MDRHLVSFKWVKSSMEIQTMLVIIKIMSLDFLIIQCISQLKMFLDQGNLCTISKTDLQRNKVNLETLMLSEFSLTTMITQDSWTHTMIKECLKTLFFLDWPLEVFHSTIMEVSKHTEEVTIPKTESLFGKIWTQIQTSTSSLKPLIKLERITKYGNIPWMKNMF